jgi:hypothetical protein
MYARTIKSMLELLEDGSREYIVSITTLDPSHMKAKLG